MKKVINKIDDIKNKISKKYRIDYLRFILILCIVYCSVTFAKQQLKINEYNIEIKDVTAQITIKENEIEKLKEFKNRTSDPEYIEKMAREKLELVKPYEKIFIDVNK